MISRGAIGERLAGFVYGTIVVMAVIVGAAQAFPHESGHIAALVAGTTIVFWLAHVYAHALAYSVNHGEHVSRAELRHIARREGSLVEAGVPSIVALLLGSAGLISTKAAVWLALGLGLAVLAVQGILFARIERLSWLGTVAVIGANLALGLILIALKLATIH